MDPQATWNALLEAWTQGHWHDVIEYAPSLLEWLAKEGYPPETMDTFQMGADWNRSVAATASQFALQRASSVLDSPHRVPSDVPFTLSCASCNNEGPVTLERALADGWTRLQYTPTAISESVLGLCPKCQSGGR